MLSYKMSYLLQHLVSWNRMCVKVAESDRTCGKLQLMQLLPKNNQKTTGGLIGFRSVYCLDARGQRSEEADWLERTGCSHLPCSSGATLTVSSVLVHLVKELVSVYQRWCEPLCCRNKFDCSAERENRSERLPTQRSLGL